MLAGVGDKGSDDSRSDDSAMTGDLLAEAELRRVDGQAVRQRENDALEHADDAAGGGDEGPAAHALLQGEGGGVDEDLVPGDVGDGAGHAAGLLPLVGQARVQHLGAVGQHARLGGRRQLELGLQDARQVVVGRQLRQALQQLPRLQPQRYHVDAAVEEAAGPRGVLPVQHFALVVDQPQLCLDVPFSILQRF